MSWKKFNKLNSVVVNAINHNKISKFNYLEETYYNHVRDLLALTIALCKKNKKIKVLDFGSNFTTWCNIRNKINTENITVQIFDPFDDVKKMKYLDFGFPITKVNNTDYFMEESFDIILYGSVAQYDPDLFLHTINKIDPKAEFHLFTHTPITTKTEFSDIQPTHGFSRFYHSLDKIVNIYSKKNYELIFKSDLPLEYANIQDIVDEDLKDGCHYANLLFRRV